MWIEAKIFTKRKKQKMAAVRNCSTMDKIHKAKLIRLENQKKKKKKYKS